MKLLIGGSPCTHWSIAQTKNRETEASGIGWELFLNYRIARDKYQPDYFLYENNKSMSSAIRAQITAELGVEPVLINSALVSAQNRQRLYWAGKRNPDGTYSQVPVELPEDRGILLRDILETKGALVVNALESWKSRTVDAHMGKLENNLVPRMNDPNPAKQQYDCIAEPLHVCAIDGEDAVLVDAEKNQTVRRSISDIVEKKGYLPEMFNPYNRAEVSEKAPTLSTGSMVTSSCAVLVVDGAVIKAAAPPMQVNEATKLGYTVIQPGECVDLAMPQSKTRRGRAMKDKTNCLTTSCDFYEYCGTLDAPIYQVRDGMITVKGQEYPIKQGRLLHHPQADGPRVYAPPNGAGDLRFPRKPQPSLQNAGQRLDRGCDRAHHGPLQGTGGGAGGSPVYVRWHELWAYRPGQAGRGDRQLPRHRDRQVRRSDHAGELP